MATFLVGLALLAFAHLKLVPGLTREDAWHPLVNATLLVGLAAWVAAVVLEVTAPAPHRQPRWVAGAVAALVIGWSQMPRLGGGPWSAFLAALGLGVLPALWAGPEPEPDSGRPAWSQQAALVAAAAWFTFQAMAIGSLIHPGFLDVPERPAKIAVPACGIADANLHQQVRDAIYERNTARLLELLAKDPRLAKCVEDGTSPLHLAARRMDGLAVWSLIRHGANAHAVDAQGRTPLAIARGRRDAHAAKVIEVLEAASLR
jgi:hypothetical protein